MTDEQTTDQTDEDVSQDDVPTQDAPEQQAPVVEKKPRKPRKPKGPETTKYRVINAAIAPKGGKASRDGHQPGDVVELTDSLAKHYLKLKRIEPYFEDDDGE